MSAGGGINPVWAHSGRELFYVDANSRMVAAEVSTAGGFHVTGHHTLFSLNDHNLYAVPNYASFDVSPDGKRFVMLQMGGSSGGSHHLVVVENFFTELRRKMGG